MGVRALGERGQGWAQGLSWGRVSAGEGNASRGWPFRGRTRPHG